jgi:hypothetical protein
MLSIFSRVCTGSRTFRPALLICLALTGAIFGAQDSKADDKKPNILVIFGDDIGQSNISRYTHGLMGMNTPTSTVLANME